MRTARLVQMANQISTNVPDRGRAAELTAEHLRAFWTPAMVDELAAHAADHPDELSSEVLNSLALLRLRPGQST
jgi:formate dehydrogenase subunit delta